MKQFLDRLAEIRATPSAFLIEDLIEAVDELLHHRRTHMDPRRDNWRHRSAGMSCATCMWWVPKKADNQPVEQATLGRCRRSAPSPAHAHTGWPPVFASDFCGDHKLDENAIQLRSAINEDNLDTMVDATRAATGRRHQRERPAHLMPATPALGDTVGMRGIVSGRHADGRIVGIDKSADKILLEFDGEDLRPFYSEGEPDRVEPPPRNPDMEAIHLRLDDHVKLLTAHGDKIAELIRICGRLPETLRADGRQYPQIGNIVFVRGHEVVGLPTVVPAIITAVHSATCISVECCGETQMLEKRGLKRVLTSIGMGGDPMEWSWPPLPASIEDEARRRVDRDAEPQPESE